MHADPEQEVAEHAEPSLMRQTGRNAGSAVGLALGAAVALSLVYTLMSLILDTLNNNGFDLWTVLRRVWGFFQVMTICAGPIVFLISFALLQRFKIKY